MNARIIRTNLAAGGVLATEQGEKVKFLWRDSVLDPCAVGHDSQVEFAYIENRRGIPFAVGVRSVRIK
jgi:hypothetical protein